MIGVWVPHWMNIGHLCVTFTEKVLRIFVTFGIFGSYVLPHIYNFEFQRKWNIYQRLPNSPNVRRIFEILLKFSI